MILKSSIAGRDYNVNTLRIKQGRRKVCCSMNKKELWVKATEVMQKTGWDKTKMKKARRCKWVKFKIVDNGYWYDIYSIDSHFYATNQYCERLV